MGSTLPCAFGPYMLVEKLGKGGTAEVFLAKTREDIGVPSPVVVKRLLPDLGEDEDFVQRFRHEAVASMSVHSHNVAEVYDAGSVGGVLYLAMEYVDGWSVARVMNSLFKTRRRPSVPSVLDVMKDIVRGLAAIHAAVDELGEPIGLVHRDVSPRNVIIGEDHSARLIDLGLGWSKLKHFKTQTGTVMGSPGYMAPEQVLADRIDHRVDLYAAGIMLYELLTLDLYIERGPLHEVLQRSRMPELKLPSAVRRDVSSSLDDIVRRAVAVLPQERFSTAREFLAALEAESAPRPEDEESMKTLIGRMQTNEHAQTRFAMLKLVEETSTVRKAGELAEEVTVFARRPTEAPQQTRVDRPSQPMPAVEPPTVVRTEEDTRVMETSGTSMTAATPVQPRPSVTPQPLSAPAPSVSLPLVGAVVVAMLAAGLGLGMWWGAPEDPIPPEPESAMVEVTAFPDGPSGVAPPPSEPASDEALEEAEELPLGDPDEAVMEGGDKDQRARPKKRKRRRRPKSARVKKPKSKSEPKPKPKPKVSSKARVDSLIARARSIRSGLEDQDPMKPELDRLYGRLIRMRASPRLSEEGDKVDRLKQQLEALQAKLGKP